MKYNWKISHLLHNFYYMYYSFGKQKFIFLSETHSIFAINKYLEALLHFKYSF